MRADRELLEMAAKAEGRDLSAWEWKLGNWFLAETRTTLGAKWNPLTSVSDAGLLAMTLCAAGKMKIQITEQSITCFYEHDGVFVPWSWGYETCTLSEAFCKCITGAAAEIGRAMK